MFHRLCIGICYYVYALMILVYVRLGAKEVLTGPNLMGLLIPVESFV